MQESTSKFLIVNFAKVLILFSLVLLSIGGFLCYKENTYVAPVTISPNDSEKDESVISIDNVLDEENVESSSINSSNVTSESTDNTNVNITNNINGNGNSNGNSEKNDTIEKTDEKKVQKNTNNEKSVDSNVDANINMKISIENSYGINILYGKDTDGYTITYGDQIITTTPIYDSNTVKTALTNLKGTLDLYPEGLFSEIKNGGIPLTIILVDSFSDSLITGVTDSSYSNAAIVVAVSYPFEETFYHESYHYIERYLFKRGANFSSWNSMNPNSFNYGTIYRDLSYSNTFQENSYFVNNYAQTDEKEDRASTFEYMMAPSKAICLNSGNPVWQKAVYMSRTIEAVLDSASPNNIEYWERFLY